MASSTTTTTTTTRDGVPPTLLVDSDADVAFEQTLGRNPLDVDVWVEYAEHKRAQHAGRDGAVAAAGVFERALSEAPGSYKLWSAYLAQREAWLGEEGVDVAAVPTPGGVEDLNATYERALRWMNRMPRIWLAFAAFLAKQGAITRVRRTFDRALAALPPSQHGLIWRAYAAFVLEAPEMPVKTTERVLKRRAVFEPEQGRAALLAFRKEKGMHADAAADLMEMLRGKWDASSALPLSRTPEEEAANSVRGELCALVAKHADAVPLAVCDLEVVVRDRVRQLSSLRASSSPSSSTSTSPPEKEKRTTARPGDEDETTRLWGYLGDYLVRRGEFERAREVYEEALAGASSARSFSTLFDAYSQFEEAVLEAALFSEGGGGGDKPDATTRVGVARLEDLARRRAAMLSQSALRRAPNDVGEWLALARALRTEVGDVDKARDALETACATVPANECFNGRVSDLWLERASAEFAMSDADARDVLARGAASHLHAHARDVADLACRRVEFELERGDASRALAVARQATSGVSLGGGGGVTAQRTWRAWSVYLDLEEALGTPSSVRAAYDRALELRVATPLAVLNYAAYLRERNFFEDSFSALDRAIPLFDAKRARDLWIEYVRSFVERYGGEQLERGRDLFEQALVTGVPTGDAEAAAWYEPVFLMYARYEERFGTMRRALAVYDRMCQALPDERKFSAFVLLAVKTEQELGAPSARAVYERAVETLNEDDAARACVKFADLEKRLGETMRARAVFTYGAQFSDPQRRPDPVGLWAAWSEFELAHGNELTYRDMLRVKRSVAAHFSVLHEFDGVGAGASDDHARNAKRSKVEEEAAVDGGDDDEGQEEEEAPRPKPKAAAVNPDEIDLDDE